MKLSYALFVGGVDPKTVRNKTWPFIFALHELEYHENGEPLFPVEYED